MEFQEEELARLELEYEIQTKIVNAAFKLLNDTSVKKNIRRQRKISHQKALQKVSGTNIYEKLLSYFYREYFFMIFIYIISFLSFS